MTQYIRAGEDPDEAVVYDSEVITDGPRVLETNSGRVVGVQGMLLFTGTETAGDIFVVHPDDASNTNLWVQA